MVFSIGKRWLLCCLFLGATSVRVEQVIFVTQTIKIAKPKKDPAVFAFELIYQKENLKGNAEQGFVKKLEVQSPIEKIELPTINISVTRSAEQRIALRPPAKDDFIGQLELSPSQRFRVEKAFSEKPIEMIEDLSALELNKIEFDQMRQANENLSNINSAAQAGNAYSKNRIRGALELSGGLALTPGSVIEIFRENQGVHEDDGKADAREGAYEINVSARQGALIGRVYSKNRTLLGEGFQNLAANDFSNPKLVLTPKQNIAVQTSQDSKPGKPPAVSTAFAPAIASARGKSFTSENPIHGSTAILSMQSELARTTQRIVVPGAVANIHSYPEKTIQAWNDWLTQPAGIADPSKSGYVVGSVQAESKAVAGAKVEVEGHPDTKVVYLNEMMIPDEKLNQTSLSGKFIIPRPNEGYLSLVVHRENLYLGHENLVVSAGTISEAQIEVAANYSPTSIRTFDAFSGKPISAQVSHQAAAEPISTNELGQSVLLLSRSPRISMVEVVPTPEYVPIRTLHIETNNYINIPLFTQAWLSKVQAQMGQTLSGGAVIGFVPDANFTADAVGITGVRKIYFDGQGNLLPQDFGVAGGGFILWNIPPGAQQVFVEKAESKEIVSQVFPIDERTVISFTYQTE